MKLLGGAEAAIRTPIHCPYSGSYRHTITHLLATTCYLYTFTTPIGNQNMYRVSKHVFRHLSRPRICFSYSNTYKEHQYEAHIQSPAAYSNTYWLPYMHHIFKHLSRTVKMCRVLNHVSRLEYTRPIETHIRHWKATEYRSMYSNTFGAWIHGEYLHSYSENDSSAISWQYCVSKLDCIELDIDTRARKQIWNPHVQSQLIDGKTESRMPHWSRRERRCVTSKNMNQNWREIAIWSKIEICFGQMTWWKIQIHREIFTLECRARSNRPGCFTHRSRSWPWAASSRGHVPNLDCDNDQEKKYQWRTLKSMIGRKENRCAQSS